MIQSRLYRSHVRLLGQYPAAYKVHNDHCKTTSNEALIGTCQLIPPQEEDYEDQASAAGKPPPKRRRVRGFNDRPGVVQEAAGYRKHWIACLFTSVGYGKPTKKHAGMDKPEVILENTRKSLVGLREQLLKLRRGDKEKGGATASELGIADAEATPGELWSCKFNSGLFAVEWADTKRVLEEELNGLGENVRVVSPSKA